MTAREPELVELTTRIAVLSEAVRADRPVPAGRLYGLPELPDGDVWVDIAGVAALTGVPPKTITGWLVRGGPLRNPFPPADRIMYRLYWPRAEIESWRAREVSSSGLGRLVAQRSMACVVLALHIGAEHALAAEVGVQRAGRVQDDRRAREERRGTTAPHPALTLALP